MGWVVYATPRPLCPLERDPVPIVQEAGWTSGLVWTGAGNLAPTGIRYPDCPARSESLYRLSYASRQVNNIDDNDDDNRITVNRSPVKMQNMDKRNNVKKSVQHCIASQRYLVTSS
jgi:hypothetical protein